MRGRRWQRLVDRQPRTTATTDGGWRKRLRTPTGVIGIVSAALVTLFTGWYTGFFGFILGDLVPSGPDAACAVRETIKYHWPFGTQQTPSERFTILIARIDHDDPDGTYTRAVARAFLKRQDIDRLETCRTLRLSDVGREAEGSAVATARIWLNQRHADLLIAGEMLKKEEAVSLWFIDKDPTHDWRASTFHLDANLLKDDFSEAASTQLLAVALSAFRPATQEDGKYLVETLKPVAIRLRHLLDGTTAFTQTQRGTLDEAMGIVLRTIGEQTGDYHTLVQAVDADRAALTELPHDQAWATTQNNLGNALARLGEREHGTAATAHWTEAVAAYRAALEEQTPDREPLVWAMTQTNLGGVLSWLADSESGTAATAHLTEALAILDAALKELPRDRVPFLWAKTTLNRGATLGMLGERESGPTATAHLREALTAVDAARAVFVQFGATLFVQRAQTNRDHVIALLNKEQK
jgi:hypothetical protein